MVLQFTVPNIKQDHEDTGSIADVATVLMMRGKTKTFVGYDLGAHQDAQLV